MLLVELAKWGAMIDLAEATRTINSGDFNPETADGLDKPVQTTLYFYETIGTLVKNGLFDGDLARDWLWVKGAWEKVGPAALRAREATGEPHMLENFEALANY